MSSSAQGPDLIRPCAYSGKESLPAGGKREPLFPSSEWQSRAGPGTKQLRIIRGFTALMSGRLDVEGGLLFVPLPSLIHVSLHQAVRHSLTDTRLTSASGVHRHWRQKRTLNTHPRMVMAIPSRSAGLGKVSPVEHGPRPSLGGCECIAHVVAPLGTRWHNHGRTKHLSSL